MRCIHYPKDKVFFVQRDEANKLFFIQEGIVKTSIITAQGEERIIEFIKAGRFLGAPDVMVATFYGITAAAYTDVAVVSFTVEEVEKLLGKDPEFSINLAKSLSQHAWALGRQLIGESFYPATGRIGYALQNLAMQIGTDLGEGGSILLPITQSELAKYVGCDRITINIALTKMAEKGLIAKKKNKIFIQDLEKLRSWVEEMHAI